MDSTEIAPRILAHLTDAPGHRLVARVIVEAVTGSKVVTQHQPVYAALRALVDAGTLAQDGRAYYLPRVS